MNMPANLSASSAANPAGTSSRTDRTSSAPSDDIPVGLFSELCTVIKDHCGIVLKDGKQDLVRARVGKLVRDRGHADVANYLRGVLEDTGSSAFHELVDALSTNLTSFNREPHHFDYLRRELLPGLIRRRLVSREPLNLRGWSAGCSTGEEPYTAASVVLETLGESAAGWSFRLLATDISTRVLSHAVKGVYERSRTGTLLPQTKQRFFRDLGPNRVQVTDELRKCIVFNYLNLQGQWPFRGPLDFIFCRNVMIYFDRPTQERLVQRFYDILAPGGAFFTGHSESLAGVRHRFRYVQPTIYTKG
jgi:chemotaxis protein methyltransferase CheR